MTFFNFRYPSTTRIPLPENAKRSQNQRKRHLAGSQESAHGLSSAIQDLKDAKIQSRPVLQQQQNVHAGAPESDMDSSLGILSPSDMKGDLVSSRLILKLFEKITCKGFSPSF